MTRGLYGPAGFLPRPGRGPAGHFRTSAHASPLFAGAVARLLTSLDEALGRPDPLDVVDIGAGHGELLRAMVDAIPAEVRPRLRLTAVELAARPAGLPEAIGWTDRLPDSVTG